jgi:hypothetical protein
MELGRRLEVAGLTVKLCEEYIGAYADSSLSCRVPQCGSSRRRGEVSNAGDSEGLGRCVCRLAGGYQWRWEARRGGDQQYTGSVV